MLLARKLFACLPLSSGGGSPDEVYMPCSELEQTASLLFLHCFQPYLLLTALGCPWHCEFDYWDTPI